MKQISLFILIATTIFSSVNAVQADPVDVMRPVAQSPYVCVYRADQIWHTGGVSSTGAVITFGFAKRTANLTKQITALKSSLASSANKAALKKQINLLRWKIKMLRRTWNACKLLPPINSSSSSAGQSSSSSAQSSSAQSQSSSVSSSAGQSSSSAAQSSSSSVASSSSRSSVPASSSSSAQTSSSSSSSSAAPLPMLYLSPVVSQVSPGQETIINVFFSGSVPELRTYQVKLNEVVTQGSSGTLALERVRVDQSRPDFAFYDDNVIATGSPIAHNVFGLRMSPSSQPVIGPAYLGSFYYRPSADAAGVFQVRFVPEDSFLAKDVYYTYTNTFDARATIVVSGAGQSTTPPNPPSLPPTLTDVPLTVSGSAAQIHPGETIELDVFLGPATNINSWQARVEAVGGTSGSLAVEAVRFDINRPDFLYAGSNVYDFTDITSENFSGFAGDEVALLIDSPYSSRMMGIMAFTDIPASTAGSAYLGTFIFRASADASGPFTLRLVPDETFLAEYPTLTIIPTVLDSGWVVDVQ